MRRWSDILQKRAISRESSFVQLGGDSLSYVEAYMAAEEVLGALPANWPELTVAQLCAGKVEVDANWTSVDTTMIVRAVAIVLIVAFHFKVASYGYGLTGALFLVSGFMFGDIQLRDVFERSHRSPIMNSFGNIFVPTFVFTFATLAVDVVIRHHIPPLASFLMSTDLINHVGSGMERHVGVFWYVDALLKILLILYAATWLMPTARFHSGTRRSFILTLFAVGCLIRFLVPAMINPSLLFTGIDDLSLFSLSPLGNFGTFMLGALIAEFRRTRETLLCAGSSPLTAHWTPYSIIPLMGSGLRWPVSF